MVTNVNGSNGWTQRASDNSSSGAGIPAPLTAEGISQYQAKPAQLTPEGFKEKMRPLTEAYAERASFTDTSSEGFKAADAKVKGILEQNYNAPGSFGPNKLEIYNNDTFTPLQRQERRSWQNYAMLDKLEKGDDLKAGEKLGLTRSAGESLDDYKALRSAQIKSNREQWLKQFDGGEGFNHHKKVVEGIAEGQTHYTDDYIRELKNRGIDGKKYAAFHEEVLAGHGNGKALTFDQQPSFDAYHKAQADLAQFKAEKGIADLRAFNGDIKAAQAAQQAGETLSDAQKNLLANADEYGKLSKATATTKSELLKAAGPFNQLGHHPVATTGLGTKAAKAFANAKVGLHSWLNGVDDAIRATKVGAWADNAVQGSQTWLAGAADKVAPGFAKPVLGKLAGAIGWAISLGSAAINTLTGNYKNAALDLAGAVGATAAFTALGFAGVATAGVATGGFAFLVAGLVAGVAGDFVARQVAKPVVGLLGLTNTNERESMQAQPAGMGSVQGFQMPPAYGTAPYATTPYPGF